MTWCVHQMECHSLRESKLRRKRSVSSWSTCTVRAEWHVDPHSRSCGYVCDHSGCITMQFHEFPGWLLFVNDVY